MRKSSLWLLCGVGMLFTGSVSAQMINGSTAAVVQHNKPTAAIEETSPAAVETKKSDVRLISREEAQALIEAEQPAAATMTPEQKAEIDTAAKKDIRNSLKKQSIRERKDFIDVMTNAEKIQKRRAALKEGKTETEARQIEAKVKEPNFNPEQDSAMEEYLFDKADLSRPPFMDEVAGSDVR